MDAAVVKSALAGDLSVPEIGCSRCAELEPELAKAREIILGQAKLIQIAEGFIKAYEAQNANRAARRSQGKKRSKAGLVAVKGGVPGRGPIPKAPPARAQ